MRTSIQKTALLLALISILVNVKPVAAQGTIVLPCAEESISGTIVATDGETGTFTIDTGAGLCTVMLSGEQEHPIVVLLGSYFGDVSVESLVAALETTQGCAVYDAVNGTWSWADCDAEGAVPATVVAGNEDGTFTVTVNGEQVTVTVDDPATAESLSEALQALTVENLGLDGKGAAIQPGDEIAAYHAEGMGFGVLAKLYAMTAELEAACAAVEPDELCGATAAELVEAFQSGMGMGQLFKEYGKPTIRGVGHVRQQMKKPKNHGGPPPHAGPKNGRGNDDEPTSPDSSEDEHSGGPPPHAGPPDDHSGGPPHHDGPKKPKKNK
ncbi:MAG: hypothetical protein GY832_19250 [Chloroflexi bacterium]|nr:hypothetical protein [Chloroflexota bacterium]